MPRPSSPGNQPAKPRPGKFFRRFRRTVRAVFIILIILPLVVVVLTQGPVPKWLVARSIRRSMGADFDASWVSLKLDGRFVARDITITAPPESGLRGDAARLASAKRIDIVLDWSAWAAGVVVPTSVKISDPVIRLSVDKVSSELNFTKLVVQPTNTTSIARVPRIDLEGGTLIVSEYEGDKSDELVRLKTRGWFSPIFGTKRYLVQLSVENPEDALMALNASGEFDLLNTRGEVHTTTLDLSRLTPERVPSAVRDIWQTLHLRGRIAGTEIRYTPETGLDTTLKLDDVSLNAPIASGRAEITGSRNPRMENVKGSLRLVTHGPMTGLHADFAGLFEDLPARVQLSSDGLTLDAGYNAVILAEKFQLEKDPRILWFAPEVVQRNFEKFSGPTAVIDARIELTRKHPESPGVPGEVSIAGTMVFENGTAAYEKFPYPMTSMRGTVRFDDDKVQIVGVQGRGPTGARLFAEGTIDPPTADSRYDIRVTATDVPMDDVLMKAMLASKGAPLIDAVFSQARFDQLVQKGLVRPRAATPKGDVPSEAPRFAAYEGAIDSIQVHVTSGFGKEQPVHQDIAVRFQSVSALPEIFPYPLKGRDVSLRIGDDYIAVRADQVTGLYGGTAKIDARIDMIAPDPETGAPGYVRPTIHVRSEHIPLEPLLINALPGEDAVDPVKPVLSVRSLLNGLHLDGPIDADVTVLPAKTGKPDAVAVDTRILFDEVTARPEHTQTSGAPLVLDNLIGALRVNSDGVWIDSLEGRLWPLEPAPGQPGPPVSSFFRVEGVWAFAGKNENDGSMLKIAARDLDFTLAVEDLISPLAPETAVEIARERGRRRPAGRTDITLTLEQPADAARPLSVSATATNAKNLQLDLAGQRVEVVQDSGSIAVGMQVQPKGSNTPADPMRIGLQDVAAQLRLDGQDVGRVTARGVVSPPVEATESTPATPLLVYEPVDVELRGLLLESPITRTLAERFGGAMVREKLDQYKPEGLLDGELRLALPPGKTNPADWSPWVALRPRWLAITRSDGDETQRIVLPLISGQATLEGDGGVFDELVVVDDGWSARFNGTWSRGKAVSETAPTPWRVDGTLDLDASGLPPSLLNLLPPKISAAVAETKLQVLDTLQAPIVKVKLWEEGAENGSLRFDLRGHASFAGLFADPGVPIDDARGGLTFHASRTDEKPAQTRIDIDHVLMRVASLRVTDATGVLSMGNGHIDLADLTAEAYGGRLLIDAHADTTTTATGYSGSIQLAGVRFADILHDLQRTRSGAEGPLPPITRAFEDDDLTPDASRGLLEAQLAVDGTVGDAASRNGRGEIRIAGGTAVLDLPGVTTLLSIASLQFPSASPFDYAHADVHIKGDTLVFDRTALLSDSLALLGAGTMDMQTRQLDVRMTGRGRSRIPLLSDLLDNLRDEIVTARIKGPIDKPVYSLENFGAVRSAFSGGPNPLAEALRTDLDRLERDRQRTLKTAETAPAAPPPPAAVIAPH